MATVGLVALVPSGTAGQVAGRPASGPPVALAAPRRGSHARLLIVERYNGAFMAFGLDVSASSATVAEADADSNGTRVFHSWLFRDGCVRQTIAEADEGVGDRIETAQLDGDRLWWVRKTRRSARR